MVMILLRIYALCTDPMGRRSNRLPAFGDAAKNTCSQCEAGKNAYTVQILAKAVDPRGMSMGCLPGWMEKAPGRSGQRRPFDL